MAAVNAIAANFLLPPNSVLCVAYIAHTKMSNVLITYISKPELKLNPHTFTKNNSNQDATSTNPGIMP